MPFASITDVRDLKGKRVLVRAGLNVPLENGVVRDEFRLTQALPTIRFLIEQGARVIVLAHIGREPEETLKPVYEALRKHISVAWAGGLISEEVDQKVAALTDGEVLLLENVRSDVREEEGDETFARALALHGDLYVNDAFSDSHRAHASIVGIPKYLPAYAGQLFVREYEALKKAFTPAHPALFILGGAKFETKMPLVARFVKEYDHVFIGGALANDFYKARGYEVGTSKVSDVDLSDSPMVTDARIVVPKDVVVEGPNGRATKAADAVATDEAIFDAGPEACKELESLINDARMILWNGPLGNFEKGYSEATEEVARMIARSSAYSIIGGGDTIAAIEKLKLDEKFCFVSTAGGAMLVFLETETLPGIEALSQK
jgi:phosphoglycerate kinase